MESGNKQQVDDDDVVKRREEFDIQFDLILGKLARMMARMQAIQQGYHLLDRDLGELVDLVNSVPRL